MTQYLILDVQQRAVIDTADSLADAHLRAAVPELLAALKAAEKYMVQNWRADAVGYRSTMASVRNAIAQTRGA